MNKLIRLDVIFPVLIALLMMTLDHHDRPFTVRDVKTKIVDSDLIIHRERKHLVSSLAMTRVTANFLVLLAAHCVKTHVSVGVFDFSKDFVSSRNLRVGIDIIKVPLERFTLEVTPQRYSVTDISILVLHDSWVHDVEEFFIVVHPDFSKTSIIFVDNLRSSARESIWRCFSENMTDVAACCDKNSSAAHPDSERHFQILPAPDIHS